MNTFPRENNPGLFDIKYYPDGNKIVNSWFIRTQQEGLPWPKGKHNQLIQFTADTNKNVKSPVFVVLKSETFSLFIEPECDTTICGKISSKPTIEPLD